MTPTPAKSTMADPSVVEQSSSVTSRRKSLSKSSSSSSCFSSFTRLVLHPRQSYFCVAILALFSSAATSSNIPSIRVSSGWLLFRGVWSFSTTSFRSYHRLPRTSTAGTTRSLSATTNSLAFRRLDVRGGALPTLTFASLGPSCFLSSSSLPSSTALGSTLTSRETAETVTKNLDNNEALHFERATMTSAERIAALRARMKELDVDVYLVPSDDPHLSGMLKYDGVQQTPGRENLFSVRSAWFLLPDISIYVLILTVNPLTFVSF